MDERAHQEVEERIKADLRELGWAEEEIDGLSQNADFGSDTDS